MKTFYYLLPAAAVVLASCSKVKQFTSDNFAVTPTPLEYVAGNVPTTISANIPSKFMNKKAIITATPVLKWNGGQAVGSSATIQGEKVEANNQIISYKNGGHVTLRTSYPFQSGMENSELWMQFEGKKGSKTLNLQGVKIGYGVQCTAALVMETAKTANFSVAPDQFQRVISQKQEAAIKFLIGQSNLRAGELNSQNVQEFIKKLREIKSDEQSLVLNNIEVSAYASPDGAYKLNEKLAEARSANSEGYVNQQLKKTALKTDVDTKYTAEDWDGFQALVSQSNLQDKEVILRVLSMYQDPEQREQEIRNIAVVYKELADAVLPELRRARMVINYDVIGRDDDEIIAQFGTDASKLSIEELLYAGNLLVQSANEKKAILTKATELYPNDYRAYNNLAVLQMQAGNNAQAEALLKKAAQISTSAGEPNINCGYLALQAGDFQQAEAYIAKGATADNADNALGNLYIAQGKYNLAASKLVKSGTNSAALAQIMAQDYGDARRTLDGIKTPDAMTYYLKAILSARQENGSNIASNLRQAISLDPTIAKRAANDVEFAAFQNVIRGL